MIEERPSERVAFPRPSASSFAVSGIIDHASALSGRARRHLRFSLLGIAALLAAGCGNRVRFSWGDSGHATPFIQRSVCGNCHVIPGVRGAHGLVGPPLEVFSDRTYMAAELPNAPKRSRRLRGTPGVEPRTLPARRSYAYGF